MPGRQPEGEQELILNRFDGTNLLVDSAYLGPTYLHRSQNWIPGETYRLEKRPGTTMHPAGALPGTVTRIHALFATKFAFSRYLYVVAADAGVDTLYVSVTDGAWQLVAGGTFASDSLVYGFEQLHDVVYVSNGIDVPKKIDLDADPLTALDLAVIVDFTDGSAPATLVPDTGASILSGTYAYCWAIFDHTNAVFVERGDETREVTMNVTGDQAISFPLPTGMTHALGAQFKAHLFVSPLNFPVEFAHDHTPQGVTAGVTVLRAITADGVPVPLHAPVRRGRALRAYYGRLILAVDTTMRRAVWSTHTLAPGLEQSIFNAGEFFPANGRLPRPPDDITGIAVAATGERGSDALRGPLVVTNLSRAFLFSGDILDDPAAEFTQISARAGNVGPCAITETPVGVFFIGTETVWMIPNGGGLPVDVGWPIRPAIKEIPPGSRERCLAFYHKNFLKLAIVPVGSVTADHQWWLDLRQGVEAIPSWWGPHVGVPPSAVTVSQVDPAEPDRGWHAVDNTNHVELIHQRGTVTENDGATVITAVLETGELTAGRPFDRKLWKRCRVMGVVGADTTLQLTAVLDATSSIMLDDLFFDAGAGVVWDATWDAAWGVAQYVEAESIFEPERPRGRSIQAQFCHLEATVIGLREIEFRYETVERPTRSVPDQQAS